MVNNQSSGEAQAPKSPLQPVVEVLQGGNPDLISARYGITRAELDRRVQEYLNSRRQMALADHFFEHRQVGRNEPCPCGSGKKYKKCCLPKYEEAKKHIPQDKLQRMEQLVKQRDDLEKDVKKGFDLLFSQNFQKAQKFALNLLESFPEDDRVHDILVSTCLALGDYENAFRTARRRWQIAVEEKEFYQENGYHKREGLEKDKIVNFYSPSTWLEKFWIAQRARFYSKEFPQEAGSDIPNLVEKLKIANDLKRFSGKQEDGYERRREALAPVLEELEARGPSSIPYLLPITYTFSWAGLFVPDLLKAYGTDRCVKLLAELSMFRFPYFAQKCLTNLETFGERAVSQIGEVIEADKAFDELKVGIIQVLGGITTPESFNILVKLTDHENRYVVNWVAQALGRHQNPEALPHLEKIKERMGALSKVAGAIQELAGMGSK